MFCYSCRVPHPDGVPGCRAAANLEAYRMRCRLDFKISVGTCMSPMHEPVRRCMPRRKSAGFFATHPALPLIPCAVCRYFAFARDLFFEEGKLSKNKRSYQLVCHKFKKHRYLAHHRQRSFSTVHWFGRSRNSRYIQFMQRAYNIAILCGFTFSFFFFI